MPDDIDLKQAFDRAAGSAPNAPAALAGLRTRIRKAHQRRALARGGAGLLGVVAVGGVIINIGGDGSGTEVALTGPGPSDSSGLTSTTFASTSAPTVSSEPLTTNTVAPSASAPSSSAAPTLPPVDSSIPGTFELVPTTRPGGLQAAVFTSAGGTIVVDYTSNAMTLTSVTADPGWTVAESRAKPDDIEVRFEDEDGDESTIRVRFVDGRPVQDEERQGPGGDDEPSDDDSSGDDSSGDG
jgi:hypothetical protein